MWVKKVKHVSTHLRNHLMQGTSVMLIHNKVLYEYYLKKRNGGEHHNMALSYVTKRFIRIIFYLDKRYDFDIEIIK